MNLREMNLREMILPKFEYVSHNGKYLAENVDHYIGVLKANIDKLQASSVRVYGVSAPHGVSTGFTERQDIKDTHQALLICIEPIEKKVKVSEILELLRGNDNLTSKDLSELAERITKFGIETQGESK